MYGFREDLDLGEIIGCTISQWCISRHVISFHIGNVSFAIESMMSIEKDGVTIGQWWGNRPIDYEFYEVLDQKVIEYSIESKDTLLIYFENGLVLKAMDINKDYESIQILFPSGKTIIV